MFVVKRPFRDAAGMVSAGAIVAPAAIKRFKHRLLEGHIVEVNEHNFERYADFFKKKYGVVLPAIKPVDTHKTDLDKDTTEKVSAVSTEETSKAVEAKKVVAKTIA